MRIAALATARFNIMPEWIYVCAANIGIHCQIPGRIEQRMRIPASLGTAFDIVLEGINALSGNLRMFSQVPGGVEDMRDAGAGQQYRSVINL